MKHSVLIIDDNHASKSASLLEGSLNSDYEVSGIVKPGAHMNAITDTEGEIIRSLTSDDVIFIWGAVAYPGIFSGGGSTNSVEDRENGDLGAGAP